MGASELGYRAAKVLGRIFLMLALLLAVVFAAMALLTELLPIRIMVLLLAAEALALLLAALLTWEPSHVVRFVIGILFSAVLCMGFVLGTGFIYRALTTARIVTTVRTETASMGIYMRAEDTRDFAEIEESCLYGILAVQDRDNTDAAIADITRNYGFTPQVQEYSGLPLLLDGLFSSQVDAVILNSAYLGLFEEMAGYEDAASRLRQVRVATVERQVEETVAEPDPETEGEKAERLTGRTRSQAVDEAEASVEEEQQGMIFTVYLSGNDTRGSLQGKSRSDVNILAAVNTATHQIVLISTPRDYYVPLSISGGAKDKLTHAGIYGVDVSMETLAMLYHVNVDYYFRVNFTGFEDIIDALGGVNVPVESTFTSTDGYTFYQGVNYMDGAAALSFVRERNAFPSGDRQRGKNQMVLIRAVIDKCISPEMLLRYNEVLSAIEGCFEGSMSYEMLSTLVREQLDTGGAWNVVTYSVDGTGSSQVPWSLSQSAYVMIPDEDTLNTARGLIYQVYTGQVVTDPYG